MADSFTGPGEAIECWYVPTKAHTDYIGFCHLPISYLYFMFLLNQAIQTRSFSS